MRHIIIPAFLLTCLSCRTNNTPAVEEAYDSLTTNHVQLTSAQIQHVGIEVGQPRRDTVSTVLHLQGKIDVPPHSVVSLSFPLGGYLKSTSLMPGMHVRKGQVLATLEDMQFIQLQQDYLMAKTRLTLAEAEYNRQRDLNASKASSDKVYQQAKTTFESERILVSALAQKLRLIDLNPDMISPETISKEAHLRSPIDGYVAKVNVNIGKYTAPTDNLFELIDPRDIHLALNVFEGDLIKIAVGQRVMAYTNTHPNKKYPAAIIIGNRTLNDDRMAEIHCHFDGTYPELAPGMFMNGEVAVQSHDALTVPEQAVVRWDNKYYVFVQREDREFEMTEVKTGDSNNGRTAIESAAITEQSHIVTRNAYALLMKMRNAEEED